MSAQPVEQAVAPDREEDPGREPEVSPTLEPVEVRRNAVVSALIGAAASAISIAYLWRAAGTGAALDWVLCVALGMIAVGFLRSLLDSRTPLLIADEMGVRVRLGTQWRGLPWDAIDRVAVQPRKGLVRDGRVVVSLRHAQRTMESLDARGLRSARANQRWYGAPLAVPLGVATRVSGDTTADLADRITGLSQGRAEVVSLVRTTAPPSVPDQRHAEESEERLVITDQSLPEASVRAPADAGDAANLGDAGDGADGAPPADVRLRALDPAPAAQRSPRVRAIAELGDPVGPLVIGDFEPEPAYDPVIGPELAAARTRVGLSVDELADRTRIRPHVIESIEVDDFEPCGGDFYARGHIRTLARVLGKDPEPMLEEFESRYATAPVNARRVFEAELATGLTGSMRSTVGGPNWALLVAVVLGLVLLWSAVRLFAGDPQVRLEEAPPILNGSSGLGRGYRPVEAPEARPLPLTVFAVDAGAHVEVRDGDGAVVYEGDLAIGQSKQLHADPPVTVATSNGAAVSVTLAGHDQGFLGAASGPATEVFQRP